MYIYKITNIINGKIYIGKTIKTIEQRFQGHKNDSKTTKRSLLYLAMRKHGIDNFIIEQLCKCSSIDQLNKAEILFIKRFKSTNRTIGYNVLLGGDGVDLTNPIVKQNLIDRTKEAMNNETVKNKIRTGLLRYRANNPNWKEETSIATKSGMNKPEVKKKMLGRKCTPEQRKTMSDSKLGITPWNKGLKMIHR
jgi:group I intron endonuclease